MDLNLGETIMGVNKKRFLLSVDIQFKFKTF